MILLKKVVLALFFSITLISTASISYAAEEITRESVLEALDLTIETAESIVTALENGGDEEAIEKLYRKVKLTIKGVVVSDSTVAVPRSKANSKNSASRRAFRKGEIEKAIELATKAVDYYKKAKSNIKYK